MKQVLEIIVIIIIKNILHIYQIIILKNPINLQNNTVFLSPTYSQLIKWLDKKYIFIAIIPIRIGSSYKYTYTIDPSELPIQTKTSLTFPTREDALEKAFTIALNFFNKWKIKLLYF